MQIMQVSFKYFQVQTHVQTARESPDLNMDFVHLTMGVNSYTNRHLCKNSGLQIFVKRHDVHNNVAYIIAK